ncbi:hypothetical protein DEO72_LG8g1206 [Vigna unguiculata]|uniref:Uncharacterized protein n=1 Tax=Vigna unguiculata TaxID=3917 RepID=A0A4D6MR15_VIGUN|nr:hypothetical protein DEO72_LG8g1206 [Vigna unguiculata]
MPRLPQNRGLIPFLLQPFVPASPPLHRGGGGFVTAAAASFHQRRCCAVLPAPLLRRFANAVVAPFRQHRCAATSLRRDWAAPSRILRSSLVSLRGRGIRVPCLFFMALFRVVVAAEVPWVCEECVGVLFGLLMRASGDPYLQHCLETVVLLALIGSNSTVVAAGLLHDTLDAE